MNRKSLTKAALLLEYGNADQQDRLVEMLIKHHIPHIMVGYGATLAECRLPRAAGLGKRLVRETLSEIDLQDISDELVDAWIYAPVNGSEDEGGNPYGVNCTQMFNLEKKQPGIIRKLWKEYHIADFGRYPAQLLERQFIESENTEIPYGIVLFPRADHNGAFYHSSYVLGSLLRQLGSEYAIRVIECDARAGVAQALNRLRRTYPNQQAEFMIIGGHGTESTIQFGDDLIGNDIISIMLSPAKHDQHHIASADMQKRGAAAFTKVLVPHPTIILWSCTTGKPGGIAEKISELGATSIGPDRPSNIMNIIVHKDPSRHLAFDVHYGRNATTCVYQRS